MKESPNEVTSADGAGPLRFAVVALRRAGVQFDVSVNPNPGEGEAVCDVFWFWKQADHPAIQKAIADATRAK